jgi:hypothetical protein
MRVNSEVRAVKLLSGTSEVIGAGPMVELLLAARRAASLDDWTMAAVLRRIRLATTDDPEGAARAWRD